MGTIQSTYDKTKVVEVTKPGPRTVDIVTRPGQSLIVKDTKTSVVEIGDANAVAFPIGSYTHTQTAAASTWVINHNLNYPPAVTTVTTEKQSVFGDVRYTGEKQITVYFSVPFSGYAYLS
jgi:hypothetical protein